MTHKWERRVTTRNAYCRSCDKEIRKNTNKITYIHSWRNRGQNIFICDICLGQMFAEMVKQDLLDKEKET